MRKIQAKRTLVTAMLLMSKCLNSVALATNLMAGELNRRARSIIARERIAQTQAAWRQAAARRHQPQEKPPWRWGKRSHSTTTGGDLAHARRRAATIMGDRFCCFSGDGRTGSGTIRHATVSSRRSALGKERE
jgi:hypothetical protein